MSAPGSQHERMVADILRDNPDAQVAGFTDRMMAWWNERNDRPEPDCVPRCGEHEGCDYCGAVANWREERAAFKATARIVPDAWACRTLASGREALTCWEVHVTTTPASKRARYEALALALDEHDSTGLELVHVIAGGGLHSVDPWFTHLDCLRTVPRDPSALRVA